MHLDDTIVAIATPPGRGGIGVVRLSGPDARQIATPMLRLAHASELTLGRAHFGELIDPATGERIDEVVATFFRKPHSYTTDDVIEISCHGSPVILRHVVEMALMAGARLAEPGEFTMRAFLNGRIDLTQAEAVRDLIEAQTLYQAQVSARQMEGALSRRLQPIKQKLVELIATMEAGIDFAEDDVAVIPEDQILLMIAAVREPLAQLLASFAYGRVVHEGLTLAIVGRPNVGKSSLFNRLIEQERAIVTATPGTTRDLVTETVAIGGIPVRLVDTAGIRIAHDEAESIGIRKSIEALTEADIVLVVVDSTSTCDADLDADRDLLEKTKGRRRILVCSKADLLTEDRAALTCRLHKVSAETLPQPPIALQRQHSAASTTLRPDAADRPPNDEPGPSPELPEIFTSCITGEGIAELRSLILQQIGGDAGSQPEIGWLTNVRQQKLVEDALRALDNARSAVPRKMPHEMILLDLYNSLRPLDEITGATTADDILNLIFSSFCIGK